MHCARALAVGLVVWASVSQSAERPVYELTLEKPEGLKNGEMAVVEGVSDPQGHRFLLDHLSVLQPVEVTLLTLDEEDDIELALAKDRWEQTLQASETKGSGLATFHVRTEGQMRIVVTAQGEPKPYRLFVWVGEPVQLPMEPALSYRPEGVGGSGPGDTGKGMLVAVGVGLGLILAAAGAVFFWRRRT